MLWVDLLQVSIEFNYCTNGTTSNEYIDQIRLGSICQRDGFRPGVTKPTRMCAYLGLGRVARYTPAACVAISVVQGYEPL